MIACSDRNNTIEKSPNGPSKMEIREGLMERNRRLLSEEMEAIRSYVDRRGLNMDTTSTGLYYAILKQGDGKAASLLDRVSVQYTLGLLDGTLCYSSDSTGNLELIIGQSDEPSGLQEGLLRMKEGEQAMLIVPSYLAFGVSGDGVCIPPGSSLIYQLTLEKIREQ
ncbi:MAG: FKBP-type peptidyl-prolyl cis-trans isomerase [Bacteroidota bacterium]